MKHKSTIARGALSLLFILFMVANSFGQLRISQVYGGGGNSGAPYLNDFVELFNPTNAVVSVTNWSIQYTSSAGTSWSSNLVIFSGTVQPGGYFLIQLGSGGLNGVALPTPNATGSIQMSATAGKVALCSTSTALSAIACPTGGTIVDFVGFGTAANCFEGAGPTPAPSATTSVSRINNGCTDNNINSTDFTAGSVNPRNNNTTVFICPQAPTVTTNTATVTGALTATLNGTVNANNASTTVTFNYGTTISYGLNATAAQSPVSGTSATNVTAAITGLSVNTLYNYRVTATNASGTSTGSNSTFYTFANVPNSPTVNGATTSSLNVTIANTDGNPASTEYAIQETGSGNYVQANGSLAGGAVWQTLSTWGTKTVTPLGSSSTYTFQVKARNGALIETAFSGTASGTTTASGSPTISFVATLTPFSTTVGTPSSNQTYSLSGSNLTDPIVIAPPVNFEVSDNGTSWTVNPSTLSIAPVGNTISSQTIYVRFNPAAAGTFSGPINHTTIGGSPTSFSVSGTALEIEPTVAPTVSFGTTGANSMVINFSGGNGASRIVVLKSGSSVGFVPTDGTTPSGINSNFTTATNQGSGDKVVYNGSGNTTVVTGLSPLTQYFVAVYEYNGSTTNINYFATPGTNNNTTLIAEPTIASTITFGAVTATSIQVDFVGGNGSSRIVIARALLATSLTPLDQTTYGGVNSDFSLAADQGSGNKVVYDGSGASVLVTGLIEGYSYYFSVYEYNGSGSGTNYLTSPFGSGGTSTPGPFPYGITGSTYSQNFNGLPATGTFTVPTTGYPFYLATSPVNAAGLGGWQFGVVTGTPRFNVSDGSGTGPTGSTYSYGTGTNTDRALGAYASSSNVSNVGMILKNTTADILTNITITYTGEQWRRGTGPANTFAFKYAVGSTDIATGTFTGVSALNFVSPVITGSDIALDGNVSPNRTALASTFTLNANWLPGQTLVLRWDDANDALNDDGISIDDFTFVANPTVAPTTQATNITFPVVSTTSMNVSWTNGNGNSRIVIMNTVPITTIPVDGNTYTANATFANAGDQVVYNGSGNSVNVNGLAPGTTYYFRVFGYNGSGVSSKYITSTATLNPNSNTTVAAAPPTKVVFVSVNGGNNPFANQPFNVVLQAQDAFGNPQAVSSNTTIDLSVFSGIGNLFGTTSGIILAGTSDLTISGVQYDVADFGVQLDAAASSGDPLTNTQSLTFDVLELATYLGFNSFPANGVINTNLNTFTVRALRPSDATVDISFNGVITLSINSGPVGGLISGTLSVTAISGVATFTDIQLNTAGSYTLKASTSGLTDGISSTVAITNPATLTELVVPKYIGSKSTTSSNTDRTAIAICIQIDNLIPNTAYDLRAGLDSVGSANTSYGAGNIWVAGAFSGNIITNAFTTNGSGSSGPVWFFAQPATSRFDPGMMHTLRVGYVTTGGTMPTSPLLLGSKTITALDIPNTARTTATTDDGAFIKGSASTCMGGKYVLVYDNVAGTGDPLYSYQIRAAIPTTLATNLAGLPTAIADVFSQSGTSNIGDYVAVIPIGANNPNGVRRIETRSANNIVASFATDADGVWPSGANTTTILRRGVTTITLTDASLNTVSVTTSTTPATCTGTNDGTATANASGTGTISYSWNSTPVQTTATATGLNSGSYIVTVSDANGCNATATAVVGQPSSSTITAGGPTTFCNGGSVTLTAGAGVSYLWSSGQTTQSIVVTQSGSYSVTVDNGAGCVQTSVPVVVTVNNFTFVGVIYSENVGTPTGTTALASYTGWQNSSPITYTSNSSAPSDVRISTASSGYSGASGSGNIFLGASTLNPDRNIIISGLNTLGSTSSSLSFGMKRESTTSVDPLTIEYSTNGTTWTALTFTAPTTTAWTLINASGTIPAASNLRLRFSKNSTVATFRIDDISITSTMTSISATANGSLILCPGASVVLTSNIPTNLTWSPGGATTKSITVNTAGSYTVTATGIYGCTATSTPVVVQSVIAPTVTATPTPVSCFGGSNGSAIASAINGTSPYQFSWTTTPIQTGSSATNLIAGSYIVTATDANGCIGSATAIVTQPTALVASSSATTILCNGGTSTITISATGGTTPYTGTGTFTVTAGTYTYTVTDANGCTSNTTITVTQPATLVASSTSTPILCNGGSSTVTVSATGGTTPYTGTGTFTVTAGTYTYTVTGANGCTSSTTITVTQPATLVASSTSTPILCNGGTSTVTVSATGGTTPYSVTGSFAVTAGTYSYTVTDANGCASNTMITVTEPTPVVVTITPTTTPCSGGTGSVTVTATGGTSPYTGTGTFTVSEGPVSYTVTDANGCMGSASATITTNPNPTATVSPSSLTLCSNGSNSPSNLVVTTSETNILWNDPLMTTGSTLSVSYLNGTYNYVATVTNSFGCTTTVSVPVTVSPCTGGISISTKVFIEGYSLGSANLGSVNGEMDNGSQGGLLYLVGASSNQADVDTVHVSLMDASTYAEVATTSGILKTDGTLNVSFPTTSAGSYFIKITHRNSIETWSATAIAMGSTVSYDFSTAATQAYGSNMTEVSPGVWAIYSGDIADANFGLGLQDGVVESTDYSEMENAVYSILGGYVVQDITGDGVVESADYSIMENNVYLITSSIHP